MRRTLFSILLLLFSITLSAQNADIDLLRNINLNRNRNLDNTFIAVTNTAGPFAYGVPALLFTYGLANKDSAAKQKAIFIGATVLTAQVTATILKYSINRTRPFVSYPELEKRSDGGSPSFPSGHTSDAFALATSVSMAYPKWYIITPAYLWAGTVGYSRMDLGVHYPSDVLAGAIIGAGSAWLSYKGQQWLNKKRKQKLPQNL